MRLTLSFLAAALLLGGCSSYSSANVKPAAASAEAPATAAATSPTDPAAIIVTEEDITDRPYETLGEIEVTVNKTTIFNADPTPELVNERLREEAAKLGADAVVLARYGTVGVSLMSWGSLDGRGRAVRFVE